jgi:hypothetical protein
MKKGGDKMKKVFMPLLALVIALGFVIALVTPALAAQGDHYKGLFKGLGGEASWSIYDEDTGVYTDIGFHAINELYRFPPGGREATQYVYIWISQYRYDADEYVPLRDVYCYGPLLPESLVVNLSLKSASLTASGLEGWQYDYATETETVVNIDINVSCSATGQMSHHNSNSHYRYPNGFFNIHSSGKSREAIALGEVVVDGASTILETLGSAYIFSAKEGWVEVYR